MLEPPELIAEPMMPSYPAVLGLAAAMLTLYHIIAAELSAGASTSPSASSQLRAASAQSPCSGAAPTVRAGIRRIPHRRDLRLAWRVFCITFVLAGASARQISFPFPHAARQIGQHGVPDAVATR